MTAECTRCMLRCILKYEAKWSMHVVRVTIRVESVSDKSTCDMKKTKKKISLQRFATLIVY